VTRKKVEVGEKPRAKEMVRGKMEREIEAMARAKMVREMARAKTKARARSSVMRHHERHHGSGKRRERLRMQDHPGQRPGDGRARAMPRVRLREAILRSVRRKSLGPRRESAETATGTRAREGTIGTIDVGVEMALTEAKVTGIVEVEIAAQVVVAAEVEAADLVQMIGWLHAWQQLRMPRLRFVSTWLEISGLCKEQIVFLQSCACQCGTDCFKALWLPAFCHLTI